MTHYIKFAITEYNGETEHETTMVARVPEGTTVEHINLAMRAFLLDWYGSDEDDWDTSDEPPYKVWTSHQTLCWISDDEQLSGEDEFNILCKHMNNQTFNINECLTKTA